MSCKKIIFYSLPSDGIFPVLDLDGDTKVIPMDYKAANYLDSKNIPYSLPETYLSRKTYFELDVAIQRISRTWWKNTGLNHHGIELGYLIEWELMITLAKLLKNVLEVYEIVKTEKPELVIGVEGLNMFNRVIPFICKNLDVKFNPLFVDKSKDAFVLDAIPVSFKIGSRLISITPSQVKIIKNISKRLSKILNLAKKKNPTRKILFLDFNIVLYKNFLDTVEQNGLQVFLLNKRRPVIWNKESLEIQLRKRYHSLDLWDYLDEKTRSNIKISVSSLHGKLDDMWNSDKISREFQIQNLNFWDLLKDDFKKFCRIRLEEAITDIEFGSAMMKQENFDVVTVWGYSLQFEKTMLLLAKQYGLPSIALQDGVKGIGPDKDYGKRHSIDDFSIDADLIAVWGDLTRRYYLDCGVLQNKIISTGSPRYDFLFHQKYDNRHIHNVILLTTTGLGTSFSQFSTISVARQYENFIRTVCEAIMKFPDKKLIVKLHPFADEVIDVSRIVHKVNPNIQIAKNENIVQLIKNSDLVISTTSTTILEAMILGKPTVTAILDDFTLESEYLPYSNASLNPRDYKNWDELFRDFFSNPVIHDDIIQASKDFLSRYMVNQGNASQYFSQYIKNELSST